MTGIVNLFLVFLNIYWNLVVFIESVEDTNEVIRVLC